MNKDEALDLTRKIAHYIDVAHSSLKEAHDKRVWEPLGYPSWGAYCSAEFGHLLASLDREARCEYADKLREQGMSARDTATVLGVHNSTVVRDRARSRGDADAAPDEQSVVGHDGKVYKARRPSPSMDEFEAEFDDEDQRLSEARLINGIQALVEAFTPKHVKTLSPNARSILAARLEEVLRIIKES